MKNYGVLRYSSLLLLIFLFRQPIFAQIQPQPIINASLLGTVIDATTKEPIEGATVQLEAVTHSVKTNREGRFQFVTGQKLPFTMTVSYIGYETQF